MKILVTGASGFIGSCLVEELRSRGHEVWEARRYVSGRHDSWDNSQSVMFDLRDSDAVRSSIMRVKPEAIIHLAAMSAVSYSFDHSQEVNEVNYLGTVRVADAARECGAWLIAAITSEVYGRGGYTFPVDENVPLGGTSPYAASKIAAVEYLKVLQSTYGMPVTLVMPFNTIGRALVPPCGNRHFVVERAITQALETGHIQLHDPRPERDFLFRTDHVGAYVSIIEHSGVARGQTFNICTDECWSIRQMAEYVAAKVGSFQRRTITVDFGAHPDRPLDIPKLHGTNFKARQLLGWAPSYTIATALDAAIKEWSNTLASYVAWEPVVAMQQAEPVMMQQAEHPLPPTPAKVSWWSWLFRRAA